MGHLVQTESVPTKKDLWHNNMPTMSLFTPTLFRKHIQKGAICHGMFRADLVTICTCLPRKESTAAELFVNS